MSNASSSIRPLQAVILGLTIACMPLAATAQTRIGSGGRGFAPPMKLGGVKAKLPRSISGVKGSLLPPPPAPSPRPSQAPRPTPRPRFDTPTPELRGGRSIGDSRPSGVRYGNGDYSYRNSDGTYIHGAYADDDFRLRFHIGSGYPYQNYHRHGHHYPSSGYPYSIGYPYSYAGIGYGYGYGSSYWYGDDYAPQQIAGYRYPDTFVVPAPAPTQAPLPPPRELTLIEKADLALRDGESKDAVELYRDYLRTSPDDADVSRSLSLALILEKRHTEAVAVMSLAYQKQKSLASTQIDDDQVPGGKAGLRKLLLAVVPFANRVKTSSAYLTVAVIMQAEDRDEPALRMLRKAEKAGLEAEIVKELEAAISPP